MRFKGKNILLTGGSKSLGRALLETLAKEGANVFFTYRSNQEEAEKTLKSLPKVFSEQKASMLTVDLSKVSERERLYENALSFLGSIDILFNNAADYDTTPFLDLSSERLQEMLWTNVVAPMHLSQLVSKQMIEKKIAGCIVQTSSLSGHAPHPHRVAHGSAKAALNMLTKNMALELAPHNIRVNAIAPGGFFYDKEELSKEALNNPLKQMGAPEYPANMALYLASKEAKWITGQVFVVDGGQSLF